MPRGTSGLAVDLICILRRLQFGNSIIQSYGEESNNGIDTNKPFSIAMVANLYSAVHPSKLLFTSYNIQKNQVKQFYLVLTKTKLIKKNYVSRANVTEKNRIIKNKNPIVSLYKCNCLMLNTSKVVHKIYFIKSLFITCLL